MQMLHRLEAFSEFSEIAKQSTSAPLTVTFLSSSQRLSARDFEKTKHNLRIEKEGSCKQVVRAPWFPEQTVAD